MFIRPVFNSDPSIDQTQYYWYQQGFNEEELTWVNNLKELYGYDPATIIGVTNPFDSQDFRQSKIKWIAYDEKSNWLYDKLSNMAEEANNTLWKFNLSYIMDSIQYTEYPENGGHYDWHLDIGGAINYRKVSLVTLLSDPNDYEGGDLEIWTGRGIITLPRIKGATFVFPSFLLHRVTPVTKGLRQSLVLWVGGVSYK